MPTKNTASNSDLHVLYVEDAHSRASPTTDFLTAHTGIYVLQNILVRSPADRLVHPVHNTAIGGQLPDRSF